MNSIDARLTKLRLKIAKEPKERYRKPTKLETRLMFDDQVGRCAICENELDYGFDSKAIHVDHCHKTNVVRGLLCRSCNTGLGMFKDNPNYLSRAILYLQGKITFT